MHFLVLSSYRVYYRIQKGLVPIQTKPLYVHSTIVSVISHTYLYVGYITRPPPPTLTRMSSKQIFRM